MVGLKHLRHLRDLRTTFHYYKGFFDIFHVTCSPKSGLSVKVQEAVDWDWPDWESKGDEHIALLEQRKKDEAWNSNGVVEFFTLDPDALRHMLYHLNDDVDFYERKALEKVLGKRVESKEFGFPW